MRAAVGPSLGSTKRSRRPTDKAIEGDGLQSAADDGRRGGDDKGGVPALLPSRDDDDDEQEEGDQEEGEQEDEDEDEGGRGGGRMGGGRRMGASGVKHSQSTNRDTARAPPRPSRPVAERSTSTTGLPTAPRLPARDPGRRGRTARALAMDD